MTSRAASAGRGLRGAMATDTARYRGVAPQRRGCPARWCPLHHARPSRRRLGGVSFGVCRGALGRVVFWVDHRVDRGMVHWVDHWGSLVGNLRSGTSAGDLASCHSCGPVPRAPFCGRRGWPRFTLSRGHGFPQLFTGTFQKGLSPGSCTGVFRRLLSRDAISGLGLEAYSVNRATCWRTLTVRGERPATDAHRGPASPAPRRVAAPDPDTNHLTGAALRARIWSTTRWTMRP